MLKRHILGLALLVLTLVVSELGAADVEVRAERITAPSVAHLKATRDGWNVAECSHFRVYHQARTEMAEKVARIAEATRQSQSAKWFGKRALRWDTTCEIYLYESGEAYSAETGAPAQSPGHTTIRCEQGRVIKLLICLRVDTRDLLEHVLPHETTHAVLVVGFGDRLPRWADEGMAVLAEPAESAARHLRGLPSLRRDEGIYAVADLLDMKDYPERRYIPLYYAQSVSLVDYMVRSQGSEKFAQFITDGMTKGYEKALRKHYSMSMEQLDEDWQKSAFAKTQANR